jgi:hypothetical protein
MNFAINLFSLTTVQIVMYCGKTIIEYIKNATHIVKKNEK